MTQTTNNKECHQLRYILELNTKIELLKYSNDEQKKEIDELRKTLKTNTTMVISSLVSVIICLIGVISIFLGNN
jgi:hypothetical protein